MTPERALWYMRMYGNCRAASEAMLIIGSPFYGQYDILAKYILQRFERELKR